MTLLFFAGIPLYGFAQDNPPATDGSLADGAHITGTLNNQTPRGVYSFDGTRCEVVSLALKATSGDLDPTLTVLDNSGHVVLSRDDTKGTRDVQIEALSIPRTDRYYVVIGRFGYALGSTAGDFDLIMQRIGVAPDSGCMLRYGDSVTNTITNLEPQFYYSFQARRGDILDVHMQRTSGNLDAYLQVVNSKAFVVADNDDAPGGQSFNAEIDNLVIEQDGVYAIVASRYGQTNGTSTGSFVLTLGQASNSGLGNSSQVAISITSGQPVQDSITDAQFTRYYTFQAKRDDLVTVTMDRASGRLDSVVALANAGLQTLVSNDDSGSGQNAKIDRYLIPADGVYYIVASRLDGKDGTSVGAYRLQLTIEGNAFNGVPANIQHITYGSTVTGTVDDTTTQVLFAFWGVEGDVITTSMSRADGDLDPVLSVLNSDQRPLVSNDDSGQDTQNARIDRYKIPSTGVYYVRATRYSGSNGSTNTHGSFIVVLARRFD